MTDVPLLLEAAGAVFVVAAMAMPAGLGGGLLYVPLLLLMGVVPSANASAALSQPVVVGAALAGNLFNIVWQARHPGERLFEPRLAVATIAPCLSGVTIGAVLNRTLPQAVILLLLVVTIVLALRNALGKALDLWRKEAVSATPPEARKKGERPEACLGAMAKGVAPASSAADPAAACSAACPARAFVPKRESDDQPRISDPLDEECGGGARGADHESSASPAAGVGCSGPSEESTAAASGGSTPTAAPVPQPPPSQACDWIKLAGIWALMLVATSLRGGQGSLSPFAPCSWEYWTVTVCAAGLLLAVGLLVRHPGISVALCFAVGMLSAIVGIGGGLVLNPMLLHLGVDPRRSTATVSVMLLIVCSSAAFTFIVDRSIPLIPMGVLSAASFAGSLSGKTIVGTLVARTGRTSILVFMLAAFMAISGSVILAEGVVECVRSVESRDYATFFGLHRACPST